MPRYSAKQRKMRGIGNKSGPAFIQLFHYVKRSTAYHGLSSYARALLIELIDRYNGNNNGMIRLSVREAAYELGCKSLGTISKAMREIDDAGLARPTKIGAWRGKHATEWRLLWRRCDKSGDLPRTGWTERTPHHQLLLPKPAPLSDADRARRYRRRKAERHENRHDEFTRRNTKVHQEEHKHDASSPGGTQNGNSSITVTEPSSRGGTHLHMYQGERGQTKGSLGGTVEPDPLANYPELPAFLDRRGTVCGDTGGVEAGRARS